MLALYMERAQVQDGMHILDLGCGWGSLSLYICEVFPNMLYDILKLTTQSNVWDVKCGMVDTWDVKCGISKYAKNKRHRSDVFNIRNQYSYNVNQQRNYRDPLVIQTHVDRRVEYVMHICKMT